MYIEDALKLPAADLRGMRLLSTFKTNDIPSIFPDRGVRDLTGKRRP